MVVEVETLHNGGGGGGGNYSKGVTGALVGQIAIHLQEVLEDCFTVLKFLPTAYSWVVIWCRRK